MVSTATVQKFLEGQRFALVGASDDKASFSGTVLDALVQHGYDVVPVNREGGSVHGRTAAASVAAAGAVDGAIVMVAAAGAAAVAEECAAAGIRRVWLFKGLGGPGSASADAIAACRHLDLEVVDGACPLMFLEPVGWPHRIHRSVRHLAGALDGRSES